jgi:NitT/TauT family transport system ATP-binding protein/nitrate/nitrite transport system substrate-binding protein
MGNAGQLKNIDVPNDIIKQVFRPDIYQQMRLTFDDQAVQFFRRSG